jgi:hypothetical protein
MRRWTTLRIPTKKIVHSELMTIRSSPKDAVESIVERAIVMGQEKGSRSFLRILTGDWGKARGFSGLR